MPRFTRAVRHPIAAAALACSATSTTACVHWQSVTPPSAGAEVGLPRLVRVTKRDSTHLTLENAAFQHDTLVGRAYDDAGSSSVRIPSNDIAHLEVREASLSGSIGVLVLVLGAVTAFFWALAHSITT